MIPKPHRLPNAALLTSALSLVTMAAFAGLSDKPPQDVSLANTGWYLDPSRSDDPAAVIEKAKEQTERRPGVLTGSEDPWGGGGRNGPWSGGPDTDPNSRGSSSRRRSPNDVDIDPTGGTSTATVQWGSTGKGGSSLLLSSLTRNPDKLRFTKVDQDLTIDADGQTTTCGPGGKIPVSDAYGDAELTCGWDGRAWVVETTRGKDFTRKDRYELSKDGKVLKYNTTATGKKLPRVKISRTYTLAGG